MFDARGPERRRNDRAGSLQQRSVRPVWVDLAVLYPRPPRGSRAASARPDPRGVDLDARVPGELLDWCRSTTGEWIGWVSVSIARDGQPFPVWQYVPAAALSPRDDPDGLDGPVTPPVG